MEIKLKNLNKIYKDANRDLVIIDNLEFTFKANTSVAIVGKSGIGKSTLLHLIGGLDTPTSGHILFDDIDITAIYNDELSSFRGANIGYIFQSQQLLPEFTAIENVAMPLIIANEKEDFAFSKAKDMLHRVNLGDRLNSLPGRLSGGEQQRVSIARALIINPSVILADEPTGSLDVNTARDIQDLLVNINKDYKCTLILVTHSDELASRMNLVLRMTEGGVLSNLQT